MCIVILYLFLEQNRNCVIPKVDSSSQTFPAQKGKKCPSYPNNAISLLQCKTAAKLHEHNFLCFKVTFCLGDHEQMGQTCKNHKHELDSQNIRIVDRDSRWFQRGVREAIEIRSRSPTLNCDRGRHNLPSVYNTIVRSELKKTGGCQEKATLQKKCKTCVSNTFKYNFMM